ncbi:ATP-binding protein [Undibacterium sp. CCC3.4]|nr:ATP-binding protein [Undibacterium sp. CCC3.4]WPX44186.1 ATP-binding protein [Undibacterium sp. CCC3.4]
MQPRIELAHLHEFEREAQHSIRADYQIRDFGLDGERSWRRAAPRPFYYPVTFMEPPIASASPVLGLDVYADKKLQLAIDESVMTQKIIASAPFNLVEGGRGYILFKALFNTSSPSADYFTRQQQATRLVSLLISAKNLLHADELPPSNMTMRLFHKQYQPDDVSGQIYALNEMKKSSVERHLLPLFTYEHAIPSEFQPFLFETQRQIGWEVFRLSGLVVSACVTLLLTLLGAMAFNWRRMQQEETRLANELLYRERDRAFVTLRSITDAVMTLNSDGVVEYVNPAAEAILQKKLADIQGKQVTAVMALRYELSTSKIVDPFSQCIADQRVVDLPDNAVIQDNDGQRKLIEGNVSPLFGSQQEFIGAVVAFRDMGPIRKKALEAIEASEKRLRQHQVELAHVARLNTMGEMAAGIAHEINQPLAAILSYNQACIRMLQSDDANDDEIIQAMKSSALQSKRAAEIITRLRAFVSKKSSKTAPVDLNQVIHNVLSLSEHHLKDFQVITETELMYGLPVVTADPIGMEQVVLNLVRNGMEAMQEFPTDARIIHIQTAVQESRVVLTVRDGGAGIPAEVLPHLFDPFLTTKDNGMGLGLTISYSIVESYGGTLSAKNLPHGGAEFSFSLAIRYPNIVDLDLSERE